MGATGRGLVGLVVLAALTAQARAEDLRKVTIEGEIVGGIVSHELRQFSIGDTYTVSYLVDLDAMDRAAHEEVGSYAAYPMTIVVRDSDGVAYFESTTDPTLVPSASGVMVYDDYDDATGAAVDMYIVRGLGGATVTGQSSYGEGEVTGELASSYLYCGDDTAGALSSTALVADPDIEAWPVVQFWMEFRFRRQSGSSYARPLRMTVDSLTVSTLELDVDIDIRPDSETNPINLGSHGNVPVVIFSSSSFDAADIDPATVTLANATVALRGKKGNLAASLQDVNGDGLEDLVVHIDTTSLELDSGDIEAVLTGLTTDGRSIRGVDGVTIVNE